MLPVDISAARCASSIKRQARKNVHHVPKKNIYKAGKVQKATVSGQCESKWQTIKKQAKAIKR